MEDTAWLPQALLEQSPACYWIVDPKGVFRSIYGDPSSLFGKPAAQMKGKTAAAVLRLSLARTWDSRFARALAGETLLLRERRGNSTWYISLFPLRRRRRILFAGGMAREITPWSTAEQELRHTVLGALKAQEADRQTASRFLHDSVGQNLTALGLQIDLVRMDLEAPAPQTSGRLAEIQKVLETMMEQVREYSYELNPSIVERAGLQPALERLVSRTQARFVGSVRLHADLSTKIDPKVATAFYHIAQEAVENALHHAGCSAIEIAVKSTRTGPILEVRDNGRGFDPEDILGVRRGLGLLSMEHYASQAALELSFSSHRGAGTEVRVEGVS
ncbi:MAG: PAS domain-containing protein [Acidobacteriia bacterium]|nr:PAS domain-containing protein [Terriglobia bacterium]